MVTKGPSNKKFEADIPQLTIRLRRALYLLEWTVNMSPIFAVDSHGRKQPQAIPMFARHTDKRLQEITVSIQHRFQSLIYHYSLINDKSDELHNLPITLPPELHILYSHNRLWHEHQFLFDNVILNAFSLFDYIGTMIIEVLLKQVAIRPGKDLKRSRFGWGLLSSICKGKSHTQIDATVLNFLDIVVKHDNKLGSHLAVYRNRLSHARADFSPIDFNTGSIAFRVPKEFLNTVGLSYERANRDETLLAEAASDLILRSLAAAVEIIEKSSNEIAMLGGWPRDSSGFSYNPNHENLKR